MPLPNATYFVCQTTSFMIYCGSLSIAPNKPPYIAAPCRQSPHRARTARAKPPRNASELAPTLLAAPVATDALPEAVDEAPTTWVCVLVGAPVVDRLPGTETVVIVLVEVAKLVLLLEVTGAAVVLMLVTVEDALAAAEVVEAPDDEETEPPVVLELPDAEEEDEPVDLPPVMANGKEYWKVVGSESSWILRPYVACVPRVLSTFQLNLPTEFVIPEAIVVRISRVP